MNKISKELAFEEDVRINFFIPWYKKQGLHGKYITKDRDWEDRDKWDLTLEGGETHENKAQKKTWPALCYETMQDTETNNKGWVYKCKADFIIYAFFRDWKEGDNDPEVVYKINWPKCFEFVEKTINDYDEGYSDKGFGHTIFKKVPWVVLIEKDIAQIVYKKQI